MSIFSAPTFYSQPDRQAYGAGNFFLPQEQYTFGGEPRILIPSGVTATTAAKSMLPFILPTNQQGDDDRNRFDTPDPIDEGLLTADFAPDQSMTGIMGMTDEEQEAINAMKNPGLTKGQLAQLGLGFFSGMPFLTIANAQRMRRQNEAKALEQAQRVATRVRAAENKAAFQRGDKRGGYQSSFAQDSAFMEGAGGGRDAAQEATSPGSSGPGGSDTMGSFMNGGLVDLVDIYD